MKNRKKALIIAIICLAAAADLYLLVVKLSAALGRKLGIGFEEPEVGGCGQL